MWNWDVMSLVWKEEREKRKPAFIISGFDECLPFFDRLNLDLWDSFDVSVCCPLQVWP